MGIDEVGRGAWAGPVTVAAVVAADAPLAGVRDSKLLSPQRRVAAAEAVVGWTPAYGIGHASHHECDDLGMTAALRLAARRALDAVAAAGFRADRVVLDGKHDYLGLGALVRTVVKGDQHVLTVAAASVIAKVTRDALMVDAAEHYPYYGFDENRGYPAPSHVCALRAHGPSAIHRRSWSYMDDLPWPGLRTHRALTLFDDAGLATSRPLT